MRNILVFGLLSAVAFSTAAPAQSEREMRKDEQKIQVRELQVDHAQAREDRGDIKEAREDLRDARQELREDRHNQQRSRYVAPYRSWSQSTPARGTWLRPKFYGRRYIISNPDHYRLGAVARGHRWIRYGDDVLLVNIRNGRVTDVLPRRYRDM